MKPVNSCGASSETVLQTDHAANYANQLLADFGCAERVSSKSDHPALAWKRSGLLNTTQLMLSLPLASHADGVLMALRALCPDADLPQSGAHLLGERARLRETVRQGRQTVGGQGRLIDTSDGRLALNLVRDDDWDLIPAWLEHAADNWDDITRVAKTRKTDDLVMRAAEIGLAVAKDKLPDAPSKWISLQKFKSAPRPTTPLVVDLSALWAAPLASSLLQMTGAKVIKVEGRNRPDGMRLGHQGFYDLINGGKDCVALDFKHADDLTRLKGLLNRADVVIEASRPRALQQLGIIAEDCVANNPGQVWARMTAYGQHENRIGFGDDIAVSAGLTTIMDQAHGEPCFVGDAIADPINGLHLALAVIASLRQAGGVVIDLNMCEVLRHAMGVIPKDIKKTGEEWRVIADRDEHPLYELRCPRGVTKALGADNARWSC
jgi:hypothetical protein